MLKQGQEVKKLVKLSFTIIIIPAIILSIGALFHSAEIMKALYPLHEGESLLEFGYRQEVSSKVLVLLLLCFVCTSSNFIFGTLLTANGNLRELNIIALSGVILSVTLNIILIPKYQAVGSAVASLATHLLVMVAQMVVVVRKMNFSIGRVFVSRLLLFIIGCFLFAFLSAKTGQPLFIKMLALVGVSLLLAISVKFFPLRQFFRLLFSPKDQES
jgi:O-antigen/teichoic acid export membrane protein